jgi:hypothetical protein
MKPKKNIHKSKAKNEFVTAVAANAEGEIIEIEGFAAVGMAGPDFVPLTKKKHSKYAFWRRIHVSS